MPESLPKGAKAIWEEVYNKNKKELGEERAAKLAWGAIKNAGWSKGDDGKWHKKSEAIEFSMHIERASYTEEKGMGWRATASDVNADKANDEMTLELYQDFKNRVDSGEAPPEEYCSDFWKGGMPYVSLSHYPDLNGDAVPGMSEAVWIDGDRFKAKGKFLDTPLGRACYKAVKMDTSGPPHPRGPVRISIAFLDYGHVHKSNGFTFIRESDSDWCEECVREFMNKSGSGKRYIKGHLIHLAMTRVPMNERTSMEVEKAMTTRKEDALSIVEDEELLEGIEEKAKLVGKSELVIKAEDEKKEDDKEDEEMSEEEKDKKYKKDEKKSDAVEKCDVVGEMSRPFGGATSLSGVKEYMKSMKEEGRISDLWYAFNTVIDNINYSEEMNVEQKAKAISSVADEFKSLVKSKDASVFESMVKLSLVDEPEIVTEPINDVVETSIDPSLGINDALSRLGEKLDSVISEIASMKSAVVVPSHPLDTVFAQFKADYDQIIKSGGTSDERLHNIQTPFNELGTQLVEMIKSDVKEEPVADASADPTADAIVKALTTVMSPIAQKLDMLLNAKTSAPVEHPQIPQRRAIQPPINSGKPVVQSKSQYSVSDIGKLTT